MYVALWWDLIDTATSDQWWRQICTGGFWWAQTPPLPTASPLQLCSQVHHSHVYVYTLYVLLCRACSLKVLAGIGRRTWWGSPFRRSSITPYPSYHTYATYVDACAMLVMLVNNECSVVNRVVTHSVRGLHVALLIGETPCLSRDGGTSCVCHALMPTVTFSRCAHTSLSLNLACSCEDVSKETILQLPCIVSLRCAWPVLDASPFLPQATPPTMCWPSTFPQTSLKATGSNRALPFCVS